MTFKKGDTPWNKGQRGKHTGWNKGLKMPEGYPTRKSGPEHHRYGKPPWNKGRPGSQIPWNKGMVNPRGSGHNKGASSSNKRPEVRAKLSIAAARRELGKPCNDHIYILVNRTRGGYKVGRSVHVEDRASFIRCNGYWHWKRGDEIDVLWKHQVMFANDAEWQLRQEVCNKRNECVRRGVSLDELLRSANMAVACWDC